MVTERDPASALPAAGDRFAAMIEPGSLLEATAQFIDHDEDLSLPAFRPAT